MRYLLTMTLCKKYIVPTILCTLLLCPFLSYGQSETQSNASTFEIHLKRAENFKKANLSGEALESIDQALEIAFDREELMEALLFKGELLRATQKHPKALEVLWKMKAFDFQPDEQLWEVKMLGRLAAVHQELREYPVEMVEDSVFYYIESALEITKEDQNLYEFEIASLHNELGMFVYRKGNTPEAREHYLISCSIFEKLGENQHLVTPLSNSLELESCTLNHAIADKLAKKLERLIEGKQWYSQLMVAYNALKISASTRNDSIAELNYHVLYLEANLHYNEKINSDKILALSEIYELDKLKQQIVAEKVKTEKKAKELEDANEFRNRLILYLIIALGAGMGIVLLFLRERSIKQKMNEINEELNLANERYQLLMIESNHRIKNNLQMITAMLEYTSKGIDSSNQKVLNSISGKINTISALHKHLYMDVHNELIPVEAYFLELIKLYDGITDGNFKIDLSAKDVAIKSERIVYFGLIFNEMLSNTLEHSPSSIDQIKMHIHPAEHGYRFMYQDGSTRPTDFKVGTGTELIKNLIIRVRGKNFELDPTTGCYLFDFKINR